MKYPVKITLSKPKRLKPLHTVIILPVKETIFGYTG